MTDYQSTLSEIEEIHSHLEDVRDDIADLQEFVQPPRRDPDPLAGAAAIALVAMVCLNVAGVTDLHWWWVASPLWGFVVFRIVRPK